MKSPNVDYGWDIKMTWLRALRVIAWRVCKHESWRGIAYMWEKFYPDTELSLNSNQYYGMSVLDCAAVTIGLKSYLSWPLN